MAVTRYTSVKDLETAIKALDASAEVFSVNSASEAIALLNVPPVGKLIADINAGVNNFLLIFTTTGTIAGYQRAHIKGGHFVLFTGAALPAITLATPVTVITHQSAKALEDYLKGFDAGATVTVYADESAVSQVGAFRYICSPGRITKIAAAIPTLLFVLDKGGKYTTVKA